MVVKQFSISGESMKYPPKPINNRLMFAYFAPDGYIQVRTIADTKKLSRWAICKGEAKSWEDYERAGYVCKKVLVDIRIIDGMMISFSGK